MKTVPGGSVREEEGEGLRPNIGIRGATSERSDKITLMEDGVLIAPAPYSNPSAYYFPVMLRMQGIEIIKGAPLLRYGPQTTGGVVNLLSTQIPEKLSGRISTFFGENKQLNTHLYFGDGSGKFQYLFEGVRRDTDGFKRIDGKSNKDTGFGISDYVIKLGFNSENGTRILLKAQESREISNETYVGLTDADFNANPNRRYGLSSIDQMKNDHQGVNITLFQDLNDQAKIIATYYNNKFSRDWYKLSGGGSYIDDANSGDATAQGVLDGTTDVESLTYKHNNRSYESKGIQINLNYALNNHSIDVGIRSHEDSMDRFQPQDYYAQTSGSYVYTSTKDPSGSNNRVEKAEATSFFVADEWQVSDSMIVNAVLRYEEVESSRKQYGSDRTAVASSKSNDTDVLLPGLSFTYDIDSNWQTLAGYHKGFSPIGGGASSEQEPEESDNFEFGARYAKDGLFVEGIFFYSDFSDKAENCSLASPCSNDETSGTYVTGEAKIQGVELQLENTFKTGNLNIPLSVAYTYTEAEISGNNNASGFISGDQLKAVPESVFSIRAGFEHNSGFNNYAIFKYIDEMCVSTGCNRLVSTYGKTESLFVMDWVSKYELASKTNLYFKVENVFDNQSIISREPDGARPNKPRTISAGVRMDF
jgi:Fe(3+) dicitrate transport protein